MSSLPTKFIILRGLSGAGKSSVAERLVSEIRQETILIEQDFYRLKLGLGGAALQEVIAADIINALRGGKHVIAEGIFRPEKYLPVFEQIWKEHPNENYLFYLDVSFDETVRRHATRAKSKEFTVDEMKEWAEAGKPMGVEREIIIPESSSTDKTVMTILETTGL